MHTDLREPLEAAWKRNTPFVFFRLPNTADIHCYWQEDNTLHTTTDFDFDGFLFAPFVAQSNNNYIPNTDITDIPSVVPGSEPPAGQTGL